MSGGFAIVQPNSQLSINAVEGFSLDQFSADAVRSQITEAQKIAGGSGSEQDIAEAKIELEVRSKETHAQMITKSTIGSRKPTGSVEVRFLIEIGFVPRVAYAAGSCEKIMPAQLYIPFFANG